MTRQNFVFIIIAFLLIPITLFSGDRPTYQFLQNDVSARASAMAGSFVSISGDPAGIFYNPATIGTSAAPLAAFGYTSHLLDFKSGFAAYTQEIEEVGVIGVGVNYFSYGSFDGVNDQGVETGTFNAGDMALSLSLARPFEENLYYGITGKYIYSSIADANSSALAVDFGLLYLIPGDDPMSLGISIANIGGQIDPYIDTKESLPFEIKVGGSIKPQHLPLTLNVNFHKLNEEHNSFLDTFTYFTVGGEFTLSKALRFRFGYNNERRKELKIGTSSGMAGFSFGGGLVLKNIRLDYSFNSFGKIGSINRITIGLDV
ncbi:MAG: type IX secretion system protein PorQ [Bacteroidota bacterium]|nr:type IX secretion system protein PorQ [Bacteroidota bacterium]